MKRAVVREYYIAPKTLCTDFQPDQVETASRLETKPKRLSTRAYYITKSKKA